MSIQVSCENDGPISTDYRCLWWDDLFGWTQVSQMGPLISEASYTKWYYFLPRYWLNLYDNEPQEPSRCIVTELWHGKLIMS